MMIQGDSPAARFKTITRRCTWSVVNAVARLAHYLHLNPVRTRRVPVDALPRYVRDEADV